MREFKPAGGAFSRRASARTSILALLVAMVLAGCSERRVDVETPCPTWQDDLEATFAQRCVVCHGGDFTEAGYDLSEYVGVLGPGADDIPNAIDGDVTSLLVTKLDPATVDELHAPFVDLYPRLSTWVTECHIAYGASDIHEPGLMNPSSRDFHGQLIRDSFYDFDLCASCHGADFAGGSSGVSCTTCHEDGPTACDTCHTEDTGAHAVHLAGGALDKAVECATCHTVPADVRSPGHVLVSEDTLDEAPAEVVLSGLAAGGSWDPVARTCSGAYCHHPNPADTAAAVPAPAWDGGSSQATCGSCHGSPPSTHADDRCEVCHSRVIDGAGTLVTALHIDGMAMVGKTGSGCNDCHGGGAVGAAPPPDLAGSTDVLEVTVGAHESHLLASSGLRGPLECADCHTMPAELSSPGHIDSAGPAEVFPAGFTGTASADGVTPVWDRGAGTCGSYCHQAADPVWTRVGQREAACGTCHALPPATSVHAPFQSITDCVTCHALVMDPAGNIIINNGSSNHIDGDIDFNQ